ncbi:hypothetical protein R1flu_023665 [Riccia fluitans]|uniref:Uncharacterized protein n=1 Tax=Riccia fluitans TaxID=41844 RepID=A0ABD1XTH6_9MARC
MEGGEEEGVNGVRRSTGTDGGASKASLNLRGFFCRHVGGDLKPLRKCISAVVKPDSLKSSYVADLILVDGEKSSSWWWDYVASIT